MQRQGIPQGSITSSFLCNLYLSHLQSTLLAPLLQRTQQLTPAASCAYAAAGFQPGKRAEATDAQEMHCPPQDAGVLSSATI
jgi:hypothetical protein